MRQQARKTCNETQSAATFGSVRTLRWTSAAAVVAASMALSACGGDHNSLPATPVTTPDVAATPATGSTESLISKGDSVCAETNTAVGAIQASETDPTTELSQVADLYDGMFTQLGDIEGAADDPDLQDVLSSGNAVVQGYRDALLAAQRGDDPSEAEAKANSAFATFASAAQSYGFTECGQDPQAPSTTVDGSGSAAAVPGETAPVPVAPTEPVPVTPAEPAPVVPTAPVTPGGGTGTATGGGTGTAPAPSTGGGTSSGGTSGGVGPG